MKKFSGTDIAASGLPKVSHASGCYLYDTLGRQYIDGSGGPAVFALGHAHAEVNEAITTQLEKIAHGYRFTFSSEPLERLTELIREQGGPGCDHVVFVSGGSEAMESALKIALQYHFSLGQSSRTRFISRKRSYHGGTLGALSVSGFSQRREQFEGSLLDCTFVSSANAYRLPASCDRSALTAWLADELEGEILRLGAENVAGFVMEPVVGAAGGVVPAPAGYAAAIRSICDRYGVLLIADEVMCGAGRCGTWRALEHDGVVPDIMTLAKGLGGGYVPLGASVYSARVSEAIVAASGGPNTGHTFTGHTLACAAATAVQEIVLRDGLVQRVRENGKKLLTELRERIGDIEAVGDVRGRGYFIGVELVGNRETREPFEASLALHERIRQQAMANGLICYPAGGTLDGQRGDVVILAPPYIATDRELQEIFDKFDLTLRQVLNDAGIAG